MFTQTGNRLLELYVGKRELIRQKALEQWNNQRGAGAVEYALIIAVVVTMVVAAANTMEGPLKGFFTQAIGELTNWLSSNKTP
ncbi:MAG: Flp family type IVb pilin [Pseudomonadota bacterium]